MSESLADIAVIFAEKWHVSPFDVLAQDVDDFFIIANRMIKNGRPKKSAKKGKQERIRVNDKTATGGWF